MAGNPTAYLVLRREDGFGEVYPLSPGPRYTMGRSVTSHVVLKDDMCSREHGEVFFKQGKWYFRDLGSLNGSRLNSKPTTTDHPLAARDELTLGRTHLLFVEDLSQLPDLPPAPPKSQDSLTIQKRLGQTRYLQKPPAPPKTVATSGGVTVAGGSLKPDARARADRDVSVLYRLALDMGAAEAQQDLVQTVLDGLLEGISADVGAVLSLKDGGELELVAYHHRDQNARTYHKVSKFVSNEVVANREAVLATVAADSHLSKRESLSELQVVALICAPVLFEDKLLGLIHLYITDPRKTLDADDLELALAVARQFGVAWHQMRRQTTLSASNKSLVASLRLESELVGASSALRGIESQIVRVAATKATVLVRGESGVGKELVARAIHTSSPRKDGPLVCLNCAAVTETLLESELFGHEKGAFTGATERMIGKFEAADHGSIFLDEIGEMSLNTQAKLLRVLENQPFERVGGNTPIRVDVRVIAATNRPLEEGVRAGTFRRDLFFRLQVVEIRVPPLRERKDDVVPLAEHFLQRFVRETGRKIRGFTADATKKLIEHDWPGNVRELRNVVERAVALGTGQVIEATDIWLSSLDLGQTAAEVVYEPVSLEEVEKRHILATLSHTDWNKSRAAEILGIERSTLDRKIKGYDLKR